MPSVCQAKEEKGTRGRELCGGTLTITAQDDADGRGVAIVHPVGFPPVEVEIHLSGIAVSEGSDFQIDEDVATESAVVENEINVVVLPPHGDAFLPGLEAKPVAELEEEGLEVAEQCAPKVGFEIFRALGQAGEFQDIGIADQVGDGFLRFLFSGTFDDGFFIGREARTLVEEAADLSLELADGPVALETFIFEKGAFPRVGDADELLEFDPRESEQGRESKWLGNFGGQ